MDDAFHHLCRAINIDTSPNCFFFRLYKFVSHTGQFFGKNNFLFFACSQFSQRFYNIRNHIACSFHQYGIANHQIFFANHIFIKK